MNAAVILIPPRLSNRHVLEMPRKNTGSKELAVGYFAAFFIEQLFEFISIGNPLKLSPNFPPTHTVRATFTAHGAPSNSAVQGF